ncbi:DUF3108 domain-containing protein [Luteolibacter luteus]|uniref:DUF3108 domain-containing protein n=1 Tax=Luteolibacter luteus TaxID=2728835 RepID=A0A858RNC3_9BACT|nr:DUF3108 domain-containing protein [Luteolibacter luteus]QJE98225.1 DUF3108 domain-containing protein [Luteolibacter luteus]
MKTLFLLLASALPALADWKTEVTPAKLGPHPKLTPLAVEYRLTWNGMLNAGKLNFTFGAPDPKFPSDYNAKASGGSSGLASTLYKTKFTMMSRLDPATLRPRVAVGVADEGDEVNTTRTTWTGPLVKSEQTIRITKNGKSGTINSEFRFTPVHDIFSAMLHVRSQKLADGDKLVIPLQPFDKPYLMTVNVLGHEKFAGRDTIKMSVALQKIDPKTKALLPYKKMKSSTLWLSDDANRIPVELRSEVFIGDVRMTLSGTRKL